MISIDNSILCSIKFYRLLPSIKIVLCANATVNGERVFTGTELPWCEPMGGRNQLALTAANTYSEGEPLHHYMLEVRRLTSPPAELQY